MDELKFKISLKVYIDDHSIPMENLDPSKISEKDIENLDGQYDWIEAWKNRDYDKQMGGFNNKDVIMDVKYKDGHYLVTLISNMPFSTIVRSSKYYSGCFQNITLKEAVVDFLEGSISDGIGENEIGQIMYEGKECEVWMEDLIEIV